MQASQSGAVVYVDEVPTLKMRSRATNFVADIDLWPISTFAVADMVFYVSHMVVADMVCGRYRCNSSDTQCDGLAFICRVVHCVELTVNL